MKVDNSAPSFAVVFERQFLLIAKVGGVAFIDDQDIGVFKVLLGGCVERAVDNGAVLGENFAPISEELRIVVLAHEMGLQSCPDVYVHAIRILTPRRRRLS